MSASSLLSHALKSSTYFPFPPGCPQGASSWPVHHGALDLLPDPSGFSSQGQLLPPPRTLSRNLEVMLDVPMPSACPAQPFSWPHHLCLQKCAGVICSIATVPTPSQATILGHSDTAKTPPSSSPCPLSPPPPSPFSTEQSEGCYGNKGLISFFPLQWLPDPIKWFLRPC